MEREHEPSEEWWIVLMNIQMIDYNNDEYSMSSCRFTSPWWRSSAWQRMCVLYSNSIHTYTQMHLITDINYIYNCFHDFPSKEWLISRTLQIPKSHTSRFSWTVLYSQMHWRRHTIYFNKTAFHLQTRYTDTLFLLLWPTPWINGLDIKTWPRYSEAVPARQK